MKIILPTQAQAAKINEARTHEGQLMEQAGTVDGPLSAYIGPCAVDGNRHADGELATVTHNTAMAGAADELPDIDYKARANGSKPRTRGGTTGLIHEDPTAYGEMARQLTDAGVSLVAEIMDESDAAIAGPWLTSRWAGTRNLLGTGTRQLMRPTEHELVTGIVPAPAFVKSDALGRWDPVVNALHAIRDSRPVPRSLLTLGGLQRTVTHPNPHTGLILRGQTIRPEGPLDEIMAAEILEAREKMDAEFGKGTIPIFVDVSHDHAKYEGGGEAGQLAVAASLGRLMTDHGIIIDGVMAETYLHAGNQPDSGTVPGLSRVDKCVGEVMAIGMLQMLNDARAHQQLLLGARRG